MPGLRAKASGAVGGVAGWSEEARKADPLGFMDYAEKQLNKHMSQLKDARRNMQEAMQRISDETERNGVLLESATKLAHDFRGAYRKAMVDGYPIEVAGGTYSRESLIEQVRLVMMQSANYTKAIEDLERAARAAGGTGQSILKQITDTQAALASLPAKKEIARVNKLTGRTQELLEQIDALIDRNETVLKDSPVRTVEELVQTDLVPAEGLEVDVMAFLEAAE
jgi:phage shock protein A